MHLLPDIITLTKELIRIPSMHSTPDEISRCADFVLDWCDTNDITARMVHHQGVPSILALPRNQAAGLLLMSHLDVVDAPPEMFDPRVEGDLLFGRGAVDDKYAVALSLVLFREKLRQLKLKGKTQDDMMLGLLITGDEETGGEYGAGEALKEIRAEFAVALDGGDPGRIVTKEKGVMDVMLTATGQAAHGARPWLGVNAIDLLLQDYGRIRQLFPDKGRDHWHRTVNFGKIRAGQSINQVPQTAQGWFNIRFTEDDDPQSLIREISAVVRSSVQVLSTIPVFASLPSPWTARLAAHAAEATLTREHGASDARHLMDYDIPGVIWGAQGFGSQHGPQECVSISSIGHVATSLWSLMEEMENARARKEI